MKNYKANLIILLLVVLIGSISIACSINPSGEFASENNTGENLDSETSDNSFIDILEINAELEKVILDGKYYTNSEIIYKQSFIDIFYNYANPNSNFSVFECSKKSTEEIYIAGYLSNNTIDYLKNLNIVSPLGMSWYISGVDKHLKLYQNAIYNNLIKLEEHPIVFRFIDDTQVSLINENERLVVVLSVQIYTAKELDEYGEIFTFNMYSTKKGKVLDNFYILENKKDELSPFIMISQGLNCSYYMNQLIDSIVFIEEYENVYCIYEECNSILAYSNHEEYFEIIKKAVISNDKILESDKTLVYDYEIIKKILMECDVND